MMLSTFVAMVVAGAVATFFAAPGSGFDHPTLLAMLLGMTVVAGLRPVRIQSLGTELLATDPFVFFALASLGTRAAVLAALAAVLGATLGRGRRQPMICQVFNFAALALSAALASAAFGAVGGEAGEGLGALALPLVAATAVYFLTNTGLAAVAIALKRHANFFTVWVQSCLWTITSFVAGLLLAAGMLVVDRSVGLLGLALGLPAVLTLVAFYRMHKLQVEAEAAVQVAG